jgi:hypothetical protein
VHNDGAARRTLASGTAVVGQFQAELRVQGLLHGQADLAQADVPGTRSRNDYAFFALGAFGGTIASLADLASLDFHGQEFA